MNTINIRFLFFERLIYLIHSGLPFPRRSLSIANKQKVSPALGRISFQHSAKDECTLYSYSRFEASLVKNFENWKWNENHVRSLLHVPANKKFELLTDVSWTKLCFFFYLSFCCRYLVVVGGRGGWKEGALLKSYKRLDTKKESESFSRNTSVCSRLSKQFRESLVVSRISFLFFPPGLIGMKISRR